eukprot:TRINITY_DN9389_c1_g1_i7.p5 TRINITY_DN9389_c1_g1~~TRINITY_DN9389_c1_g1_i7.p5  ORF type:complete len:113 (-),score=5.82 TRINITY_DN9389_c1_g1_i7:872-1210(-)
MGNNMFCLELFSKTKSMIEQKFLRENDIVRLLQLQLYQQHHIMILNDLFNNLVIVINTSVGGFFREGRGHHPLQSEGGLLPPTLSPSPPPPPFWVVWGELFKRQTSHVCINM